jgi:hypothetical protein
MKEVKNMDKEEPLFVIEMKTHAWEQSGYVSNNLKPGHLGLCLNITFLKSKCSKDEIYSF